MNALGLTVRIAAIDRNGMRVRKGAGIGILTISLSETESLCQLTPV